MESLSDGKDRARVNVQESKDNRRWADKFGCTKQELEQAVKKVGSASGAVRAELARKVPLRPQRQKPVSPRSNRRQP